MTAPVVITETSVPRLPRGVRLRYDAPRERWVILAPERMFVLDAVAYEVIRRCDGKATTAAVAADLAEMYAAPRDVIMRDVTRLLQAFAEKGVIAA